MKKTAEELEQKRILVKEVLSSVAMLAAKNEWKQLRYEPPTEHSYGECLWLTSGGNILKVTWDENRLWLENAERFYTE